ncbi:MAG: hypothetical protein ACK4NX_02470, partial [Candidatus Paceibacteria bacterium]
MRDIETAGRLKIDEDFKNKTFATDANTASGAAMRAILYERGMIDPVEFTKDLRVWMDKNPLLADKMLDLAQRGGFKGISATQILDMASGKGTYEFLNTTAGINIRKKLFKALVGDKEIPGLDQALAKMDVNHLKQAIDLLGGDKTNEAAKYKKTLAEKRPDIVAA